MALFRKFMYLLAVQLMVSVAMLAQTSAQGRVDLQAWDPAQALRLSGQWAFFPNEHLSPGTFLERWRQGRDGFTMAATGQRFQDVAPAHFPDDLGRATYALVMDHVPAGQLALEGVSVYTSGRILAFAIERVDDTLVSFDIGEAGADRAHTRPLTAKDMLLPLRTNAGESWVILIHVSNFHHSWGGLWLPPRIGDFLRLSEQLKVQDKLNYWLLGLIFFLAIYSTALYLRRPEDRPSLYLAAFSLILCLRLFVLAETGTSLIPDSAFKFELTFKVIYGTMILGPLGILLFVNSCFPNRLPRAWMRGMTVTLSLPLLVILFTPATVFGQLSNLLKMISLFLGMNCIVLMVRAVRARDEGAVMSLSGFVFVMLGVFLDVLNSYGFDALPQNSTGIGMSICIICQSQIVALRFASAFRRSEHLSRELQSEVAKQTRDITSILAHIRQGIFTISSKDKRIDELHSEYLKHLTRETEIKGQDLRSLLLDHADLDEDQKVLTESSLEAALGEDPIAFEMNAANLIHEVAYRAPGTDASRVLELDWNPMLGKDQRVEKVLVSIRDVTDLRQLEAQTQQQEEDMKVLMELIQIPEDRFHRFIEKTLEYLEENRELIQSGEKTRADVLKRLFVNMHTIKGASRTYYLAALARVSHEVEQYYAALQKQQAAWDAGRLLSDVSRVEAVVEHYRFVSRSRLGWQPGNKAIRMSRKEIEYTLEMLARLEATNLNERAKACLHEAQRVLLETCTTELQSVIDECCRGLDSMARDLGKATPIIELEPGPVVLKDKGADLLHSLLTHLVRNSVDHGFEKADERVQKGKPREGRIRMGTHVSEPYLYFHYRDDGRGLDLVKLEAIGQQRGLLASPYTDQDVAELIFRSGLSTKDAVSEISGRGVGLDAVRSYLEEVGGAIELSLDPHRDPTQVPFRLIMTLPLSFCFQKTMDPVPLRDVAG